LTLCALAAAGAVAGCADGSTSGETTGSLHLSLELASGVAIDEVRWTISRADMEPMNGTYRHQRAGRHGISRGLWASAR
jgi:hypothetical protein